MPRRSHFSSLHGNRSPGLLPITAWLLLPRQPVGSPDSCSFGAPRIWGGVGWGGSADGFLAARQQHWGMEGMICPLPGAAAPVAASQGLGACLGQMCPSGPAASCGVPEHPAKPPGTLMHFGDGGFPSPTPSVSALPPPQASTMTAELQSEQWGLCAPPGARHPPCSRRDFGKEINTRWERAGLPGTHSPHAKSCWREWARGLGVPVLPKTAHLVPWGLTASWGQGQRQRDLQPPTPLCPHMCWGCLGQGTHPLCWRNMGRVPP